MRSPRSPASLSLDARRRGAHGRGVNLLLPQSRTGTVRGAMPLEIHGDRYVDLLVELDGEAGPPMRGRVGATDCPADLSPGDRVSVRITMGVMMRVERERG